MSVLLVSSVNTGAGSISIWPPNSWCLALQAFKYLMSEHMLMGTKWSQPQQPVLYTIKSQAHGCSCKELGLERISNHTRKSRAGSTSPSLQGWQKMHSSLEWGPWQCTRESQAGWWAISPVVWESMGLRIETQLESQVCNFQLYYFAQVIYFP